MSSNKKADLYFEPSGQDAGFTPAATESFGDCNPHAIIRELLQNSIDAGKAANRDIVKIRFEVDEHPVSRIPGINTYTSVFNRACNDQRAKHSKSGLPDQAQRVIDSVESVLLNDSGLCRSLFVLDNGTGLEPETMNALIGDGQSIKPAGGGGSYGVGHNTAIVASNLRYVLYAGRNSAGDEIISGHAILAGHKEEKTDRPIGGDGYYVKHLQRTFHQTYDFQIGGQIPTYLKKKLDWIKDEGGTGTVVAITGFDNFNSWENMTKKKTQNAKDFVGDIINKAAASNFFPSLWQGVLEIEFYWNGELHCKLNKNKIEEYLKGIMDEKRNTSSRRYLVGSKAYSALLAIKSGVKKVIDTGDGNIHLYVLTDSDLRASRADICRNGMWITGKIPEFDVSRIPNRKPFHAVILLDADDGGKIWNIVRKAEGPLHDNLDRMKNLNYAEKQQLKDAMRMVEGEIKNLVPEIKEDSFFIEDMLALNTFNGLSPGTGGKAGFGGEYEQIKPRPPSSPRPDNNGDSPIDNVDPDNEAIPTGRTFDKAGRVAEFRVVARYPSMRSCQAYITPQVDMDAAEIRFKIDENIDDSCIKQSQENFAILSDVIIDGDVVSENRYSKKNGMAFSVRVANVKAASEMKIEFKFESHPDLAIPVDQRLVLNASIVNRQPDKITSTEEEAAE